MQFEYVIMNFATNNDFVDKFGRYLLNGMSGQEEGWYW